MAGRIAWILAGGAALFGGLIYQGRIGFSRDDVPGSAIIVDERGERANIDHATAKALAAAVGRLVKAETRLATRDAIGDPSAEELQAAKVERERAEAEVDRIEAVIEARAGPDKHRLGEQIRTEMRKEIRADVREAVVDRRPSGRSP